MKTKSVHYIIGEENEYDEILTICGIYITTAGLLRMKGKKAVKNKYRLSPNPAATTCLKCMETEEWKKAVASKFANKMLGNG
jgi:hypothetical protein